jgi:hypothetical protein
MSILEDQVLLNDTEVTLEKINYSRPVTENNTEPAESVRDSEFYGD